MTHARILVAVVALTSLASVACGGPSRSATEATTKDGLPSRARPHVVVLSGEMPGALRDIARHSWIVANVRGADGRFRYRRYEWLGAASATDSDNPFDYFGNGEVAIHGVVVDEDDAKLAAITACLERETKSYHDANCGCWPGPNSNTFADGLIRTCGLGIELPATALGRDYRGPIGVSVTEGRTGVQLETWLGGAKLGLKEGASVDLAGLPLGVHFWPPGIEVPVNPGRIGLDTSVRRAPDPTNPDPLAWLPDDPIEHAFGAASIAMAASVERVATPALAAGLSDRATFGLAGHAVLGMKGPLGFAFGGDLAIGAAAPLGFAYAAHLSPVGVGLVLGDTGFLSMTSGAGTWGVSSSVRGALELPQELRLELDIANVARLGLHGGFFVVPDADDRKTTETFFGATTRLGTRASGRFSRTRGSAAASGGFFLGLERREILRSYLLGVSFGYEIGAGG